MSRLDRLEKAVAKRDAARARSLDQWQPKTDEEKDALLMAMHWLFWGARKELWPHLPDDVREAYERDDKAAIRATQAPDLDAWADGYTMPDGSQIVPLLHEELDTVFLHRFHCVCNPEIVRLPPRIEEDSDAE